MKKIKCKNCQISWVVKDESIERIKICPSCGVCIQKQINIEQTDSLDKVIYYVISKMGSDTLDDIDRFNAIMADIAPDLKKEIRIFSKNVNGVYTGYVREILNGDFSKAESVVNRMKFLLVENEGLSESWANLICDGVYGAAKYMNGDIPKIIVNSEVSDYSDSSLR